MAIEDRYDVHGPMGEGGFSRVYRGSERTTGRPVALKVLKSAFHDNAEVRERFQREVFAVASLSSPHIVGMYDFDLNAADVYIAMEYVPGSTLRERLRDPLTLAERFAIVAQTAAAIATAHARNVVHRDLKPENIKLAERVDGAIEVKVLDFGMAKLSELESRLELRPLTKVGICFGTPQYMSPEQIRGKLDDRSIDLFALAIITYELIAGRRPWDGSDPYEVMRSVLRDPAPVISRILGVEVQDAAQLKSVNAFFSSALAKQRDARPEDVRALVAGLELALFGSAGAPVGEPLLRTPGQRRRDDTMPVVGVTADMAASISARILADSGALSPLADVVHTSGAYAVIEVAEGEGVPAADVGSDTLPADMAPLVANFQDTSPEGLRYQDTSPEGMRFMQGDELASHASLPAREREERHRPTDVAMHADAVFAAESFSAARRSERSFRGLLVPLFIIAVLGGSLGYLLAGSGSGQANDIHDFLVGKK